MKTEDRHEMCRAGVALTFRSARRRRKNADLKVGATNFREQSENVYENKGPVERINHLCPPYPRQGTTRFPSSQEEGLGVVSLCKTEPPPWNPQLPALGFRELKGDKESG